VGTGHDVISYVFVIWVGHDFWVMRSIIIAPHQNRKILIVVAIAEPLQRSGGAEDSFTYFEHSLVSETQSETEVASRCRQELLFIPFNGDPGESLDEPRDIGEILLKCHCPAATSFCSSSALSCK